MSKFPHYLQSEAKDCGPTAIRIVAKHYGKAIDIQKLRELAETTRTGSSLLGLSEAAEAMGFHTVGVKLPLEDLTEVPLPAILHWNGNHFVVVYKVKQKKSLFGKKKEYEIYVSDPAHGLLKWNEKDFLKHWIGNNAQADTPEGIALLIEPTPKFYNEDIAPEKENTFNFRFVSRYIFKYKRFVWQLAIGLLAGSLLQLIVPFLTQSVVDVGIKNQDIHFVYLILIAQILLFIGQLSIQVIRSWIMLHLSTRINISLISDFFIKLMKLPVSYFDVRMTGDILQRINDHKRIQNVLTTSSLNTLFSIVNFVIFGFVLGYYSPLILGIFVFGSALYFIWIFFFLKRRAELDYKNFSQISQEQSKVIEIINGMQEIKLHNAEKRFRWNWEFVQAGLFKIATKSLTLEQTQSIGSSFINKITNVFITIVSAKLVIDGQITLGMMMAISYIVGQLNAPVTQLIGFIKSVQDAKISLDRLGEIHNKEDEENPNEPKISDLPANLPIHINNISFRYPGTETPVIKNLSLEVPENKITAIVGTSGSGKTTLLKLMLKVYQPDEGKMFLGTINFDHISPKAWRNNFGVVMQEGYIFNDTIAQNIAVGADYIDKERLRHAVDVANIKDFIETLPLQYNTEIGNEGVGLSTGQKQRILIARAVYKNPDYLFLDEATSALDANNEKEIMQKLNAFFQDRTVVVIAHRLSTVKNAHQIVVLEEGRIVEQGSHKKLVKLKGKYYHLVKNQLDLGK
jgi:ATP-binding cassette subfamily B protein